MPQEEANAAGEALARFALADSRVRGCRRVGLYAFADGEPPTERLFDALIAQGTQCLFPRVRGGELDWVPVERWEAFVAGSFRLPEPPGAPVAAPGPGEGVFVPSVAFDGRGARLGRGGGFYDRAFPVGTDGPWLLGVGYAFQRVDAVPEEPGDRRIDGILTERGLEWWTESS